MAMGHDEVDEDRSPLQQERRRTGACLSDPKTRLPVCIHCVQCGIEIAIGSYCKRCLQL